MPSYSKSSKYEGSSPWPIRIDAADKQYGEWSSLFKCDILEKYYEGFQWAARGLGYHSYNPYTLNLFFSTIKIKMANFLFQRPNFILTPAPGSSDYSLDFAVKSSTIKQDTLNQIVKNPRMKFVKHLKLAALDSFFRFGLVEVGYAADWRNPQKESPHLLSWEKQDVEGSKKDRLIEDTEVPYNEMFYVKRIRPKRFRIAAGEFTDIDDAEWCGYYEYCYTNVLKKTPGIKWPADYSITDYSGQHVTAGIIGSANEKGESSPELQRMMQAGAISKIWHIFDNVANRRCLYLDNYWDSPLWEEELYRLPLIDIRWDFRLNGFYPIPPCSQWISPQDEINEAREQTRSYRRRFTRKFQAVKGKIDEEEKEKFVSGPDGVVIEVKELNALSPIENPQLGQTTENALLLAKDDFVLISGSSAEVRKSDRETATKSSIEDQRAKIRESAEQLDFSEFVCLIGREILCQAQEKMSVGLWAKSSLDPGQELLQDMQAQGPVYQYITNQDISDGYDFEIEVDVMNGTPQAMAQQETNFVKFLTLLQKFPVIALSPLLIRRAAYICGFRDEQVIQQMQQAAMLQMAANANAQSLQGTGQTLEQAGQAQQGQVNNEQINQMAPPTADAIEKQLENQMAVQ